VSVDPVRARRARMARLAATAKRIGYSLFLVAVVAFVAGVLRRDFGPPVVTVVAVALGIGSLLLAPAIVVGYGVRAADREDRESGW
jgi:hypothetical protein